jgi:O-antigen/teichoic acid export membrane protein
LLTRIKTLFRDQAIYGFGTVATSVISLLLLPVYTLYFSAADLGILALLNLVEAFVKVVFRWGVDTAYMRLYYDCADHRARQRLTSTIFFFLLAANGVLLLVSIAAVTGLSRLVGIPVEYRALVTLTIANLFVGGFYFIPFFVMRIEDRPRLFTALTAFRSLATVVGRLVLVVGLGLGLFGPVAADLVVTGVFTLLLLPWFIRFVRPMFSRALLKEALVFGAPRIPHSLAQQVLGFSDRYFLRHFGRLSDVGFYSLGQSFGMGPKYFMSAFETAWTPFFLTEMSGDNPRRTYSVVSTYVTALFVLLAAGMCATAPDVVRVFTAKGFFKSVGDLQATVGVVPWTAVGALAQGLYLLVSIGLVIQKKTTAYPISTGIAAVVIVAANFLWVPRYGGLGAAWANAVGYVVLTVVTGLFSWKAYAIPYEWGRLARVALAGIAAWAAGWYLPVPGGPIVGLLVHGVLAVVVYAGVLFVTRFFHAGELQMLRALRTRARQPRGAAPSTDAKETIVAVSTHAETVPAPLDGGGELPEMIGFESERPDEPGRDR